MQPGAPRHYTHGATHPGFGLPGDRDARTAARRAFVELKQTFMHTLADLPEPQLEWLHAQVRGAEEPVDLWLLRAPIFAALAGIDPERRRRRQLLRRGLDSVFHDSEPASIFGPL